MKRTSQTGICLRHCQHTVSHGIHRPDWYQYYWRHKGSIAALPCLYFKAKVRGQYNPWTVHELSDLYRTATQTSAEDSYHSVHIDMKDTSGEKNLYICRCHPTCFDV